MLKMLGCGNDSHSQNGSHGVVLILRIILKITIIRRRFATITIIFGTILASHAILMPFHRHGMARILHLQFSCQRPFSFFLRVDPRKREFVTLFLMSSVERHNFPKKKLKTLKNILQTLKKYDTIEYIENKGVSIPPWGLRMFQRDFEKRF